jgi:hypothetical protein
MSSIVANLNEERSGAIWSRTGAVDYFGDPTSTDL